MCCFSQELKLQLSWGQSPPGSPRPGFLAGRRLHLAGGEQWPRSTHPWGPLGRCCGELHCEPRCFPQVHWCMWHEHGNSLAVPSTEYQWLLQKRQYQELLTTHFTAIEGQSKRNFQSLFCTRVCLSTHLRFFSSILPECEKLTFSVLSNKKTALKTNFERRKFCVHSTHVITSLFCM